MAVDREGLSEPLYAVKAANEGMDESEGRVPPEERDAHVACGHGHNRAAAPHVGHVDHASPCPDKTAEGYESSQPMSSAQGDPVLASHSRNAESLG